MRISRAAWILTIMVAEITAGAAAFASADGIAGEYQQGKKGTVAGAIMEKESTDINYDYTLHSPYLKRKVLEMADVIANASLFAATGYVRDHGKRKFVFLERPPIDRRVLINQTHKLKRMGSALRKTHDDDYKLAGEVLIELSRMLLQGGREQARRQVLLFEEFYRDELTHAGNLNDQDHAVLSGLSGKVIENVKQLFDSFSESIQHEAMNALHLESFLGGLTQ